MSNGNRFAYLVYTSTATNPFTNQQLFDLLSTVRVINEKLDVTGALIYKNGIFIQFLEGPEQAVKTLREKIYSDPRHCGIMTLVSGFSEIRVFAEWTMHFISSDEFSIKENTLTYRCLRGQGDFEDMLETSGTYKLSMVDGGLHPGLRLLLTLRQIM